MDQSGAGRDRSRLAAAWLAVCAGSAAIGVQPAFGQTSVGPVIEPSPMIAQGHLEGGINGEGNPRPDGKTPLMLAVEADDLKVIEYLLQHGVDPEMKDVTGATALDIAQRSMKQEAADALRAQESAHPRASEYYADKTPVLAAQSAKSQSGSPGSGTAHSLVVRVTGQDGRPLTDAPVRFMVEGGGKYLLTQASSPDSPSLLLRTDEAGCCRANVHLPKEPDTRIHIIASAGLGEQISSITFTALTNDGTGGESASCFEPSDVRAAGSPTGDLDVSWTNNTDDETAIKVWVRMLKGWRLMATLPPHTTSAHLPAESFRSTND